MIEANYEEVPGPAILDGDLIIGLIAIPAVIAVFPSATAIKKALIYQVTRVYFNVFHQK